MKHWRKFFALPAGEKRLLLEAAARLAAARVLLSTVGMVRTQRLCRADIPVCNGEQTGMSAPQTGVSAPQVDHEAAERFARAVIRIAPHLPVRTNCLDRAMALSWLLSSRGLAAELRIGVRKNADFLGAHAWVEHDGVVLLDDEAAHYVTLDAPVLASGDR